MRLAVVLAAVLLPAAGALAGLLATGARRPPPLAGELDLVDIPFVLQRKAAEPLLLSPSRWLELPMLRADFDLLADVELGEGAVLDVVVRRVEPRPLQGTSLGFQSRYCALRLSTAESGPPWRTPEAALLGPPGGVRLLAGSPASLSLQARGRSLHANVAGRVLDEMLAQDEHGSVALIARGGTVAVRALSIQPVAAAGPPHPAWLGAAVGLLLAAVGRWRRPGAVVWGVAVVAMPLGSALACRWVFAAMPPLANPEPGQELAVACAGAPLALALLAGGRWRAWAVVAGLAAAAWLSLRLHDAVAVRFPPTVALDALLGPQARETSVELLGQRLRGPMAVHTVEPNPQRVMLLGGQLLYRRGAAPDQHVQTLLGSELRASSRDVDVVAAPTEDGWAQQQWRLYDLWLRGFQPRVLVFGVPRDEAVDRELPEVAVTTPAALAALLSTVQADCQRTGTALVLLADHGLDAELLAVVRAAAAQSSVPLVEVRDTDAAVGIARKLAAVLAPLLR